MKRNINILAWSGAAVLVLAIIVGLFAHGAANKNTPVVMQPAKAQNANDKGLVHSNVPTTPTLVHSGVPTTGNVLSSPVHKTGSTSVNAQASGLVSQNVQKTSPPVDPCAANPNGDKCCAETNSCTDPNRPYYDGWGNEFAYDGTLMHAACPNVPDPISGKNNSYCVCPPATDAYTWYILGYDKDTNMAVCHIEYYHACPYSENVSADDPMCYKNNPQQ